MSRSANTERVRSLVKQHLELAKKVQGLELDARTMFRYTQQMSEALLNLSQQTKAISDLLDHLESTKQVTFPEALPEEAPAPETLPTPPAEPSHGLLSAQALRNEDGTLQGLEASEPTHGA